MRISDQITLADVSREYAEFIDKFKPKKTTDDCYTPDNIYEAILSWVCNEYGVDRGKVVRPFWPGADYLEMDYPEGCCVVDNPPFSIVSQICKDYLRAGIKFFLFCPHLTSLGICQEKITHITCAATITYENGAEVNTGFVTNLDDEYVVRTAPDLAAAIADENKKNTRPDRVLPKYEYPVHVFTASMGGVAREIRTGLPHKKRRVLLHKKARQPSRNRQVDIRFWFSSGGEGSGGEGSGGEGSGGEGSGGEVGAQ